MEHLKARDEQIEEMRREIKKLASTEIGLQHALAVERSWHAQACKDRDDAQAVSARLAESLARTESQRDANAREAKTQHDRVEGIEKDRMRIQNLLTEMIDKRKSAERDLCNALTDVRHLERSLMRIGERLGLSVVTEPDIMAAIERMRRPEILE